MTEPYSDMIAGLKDGSLLREPIGKRLMPGMQAIASIAQADRFIRNYVVWVEKNQRIPQCEAFTNMVKKNVEFACSYWYAGEPCAQYMLEALRMIQERHSE